MKLAENYEMERGNRKLDNLLARMDQSQKAWMQGEPGPDYSLQLCHDVLPSPYFSPAQCQFQYQFTLPNLLHPHLALVR
jgi:hypothetical protein